MLAGLIWHLDLGIGAGFRSVYCGENLRDVGLDDSPPSFAQDDNCDFASGEVLLIGKIAVSGYDHFKPRGFRDGQEFAVFQFVPTPRTGLGHGVVTDEIPGKGARRSVVEQNEHLWKRRVGWRRFGAVSGEFQNRLNLFPSHAELFHEFIDGHVLKIFEHC